MSQLYKVWDRLVNNGESGDGFVRLRLLDVKATAVYAAKSVAQGLEAVLLEVNTNSVSADTVYPEAHGFSVQAEMLTPGRHGQARLMVMLTDSRYRDIFRTLAEDIITKLADVDEEEEAVRVFVMRLSRWQSFMQKHRVNGLSLEARRGLLGELLLLRDHLMCHTDHQTAVTSWKGCRGANHDFQFAAGSIEVKTTSANSPHSFHVSNIRQLDSPGQGELFLYLLLIDESEAGDQSLSEVIESIRIGLDAALLPSFDEALIEAGYLQAQCEMYSSPRYTVRHERFFLVNEFFPRLREDLLPPGVEDVRYQVAVAACTDFETLPTKVLDIVLAPRGGEA